MTTFGAALHQDTNGRKTSSTYGNAGDGVDDWYTPVRLRGLEKAEDAAHASGDLGVMALAVRRDSPTTSAGTDGDYSPLSVDSLGRLRVTGVQTEDAAHTSGDQGVMALAVRNQNLSTFTSADGDYSPLSVVAGGILVSTAAPTSASATSPTTYAAHAAASGVIRASAGKIYALVVTNDNAARRYLMLHNATSVPADGVAPLFAVALPANSSLELDFGGLGLYFSTGISWSLSSTFATKTIAAADASLVAGHV